jgi:hypothetical protein
MGIKCYRVNMEIRDNDEMGCILGSTSQEAKKKVRK